MWFIFLDEAGFAPKDWQASTAQQPYYVLSAVCFPSDQIEAAYRQIRAAVVALNLERLPKPLGQGHEIKAKEIAAGSGWWHAHNVERNGVRDAMLLAPARHQGSAFVVVVDKAAHAAKYMSPVEPHMLAFQFIFERLAHFLEEKQDLGYCVYDQNTRIQADILAYGSKLIAAGSYISGYSAFYEQEYEFVLKCDRLLEMVFGDSQYSLGLQVADYFATFAYQYFRDGKPAGVGWWTNLTSCLHRARGILNGVGLKVFP